MPNQRCSRAAIGLAATFVAACAGCSMAPSTSGRSSAVTDPTVISQLEATTPVAVSTVPPSGDINPYGVAFVPDLFPGDTISGGDILVANFNNSGNAQGTGSSIVAVRDGTQKLFFQGPPGLGLSTAIGVLRKGFVIVGNVQSTDGSGVCTQHGSNEAGAGRGMLMVLDRNGNVVESFSQGNFLNGPWDLTVFDAGDTAALFVSNALNGTVARIDLSVGDTTVTMTNKTIIASGYVHRCDPAAFVVGPTGVAFDSASDTLYVASTGDNEIFKVENALERTTNARTGTLFIADTTHFHGPLGLVIAPNGDFLTTQGDAVNPDPTQNSELVEFDPEGRFLTQMPIPQLPSEMSPAGAAFGLAIQATDGGYIFAAVDDAINVLDVWTVL
jgi:hypothetical protein